MLYILHKETLTKFLVLLIVKTLPAKQKSKF